MDEIRETVREAAKTLRMLYKGGHGDREVIMLFPEPGQCVTQIENPVECKIEFIGEVFRAHKNWRMVILEQTRMGG